MVQGVHNMHPFHRFRRRPGIFAITAVLAVLTDCRKQPEGFAPAGGTVEVSVRSGFLSVSNGTPEPVHYFAVEQGTASLIDWVPRCVADDPNQIAPMGVKNIDFSEILGLAPNCRILFYWWHCPPSIERGITVHSVQVQTG